MPADDGHRSPSGVWVADDFRSNLIIDRYDPVFDDMRAGKLKHLRSTNSEDAVTWNVFRSLRQIAPEVWVPSLWRRAFPGLDSPADLAATVTVWESVPPPSGLLVKGDEGHSEIDVVIETASWVWFIEAKYRSDISTRTTRCAKRDQILRNVDVGTHYAGVRPFVFSLLIASEPLSPLGVERLREYADFSIVRDKLAAHRPDRLPNLHAIGQVTWFQLAEVLADAEIGAPREDERAYAARAREWLGRRVLSRGDF